MKREPKKSKTPTIATLPPARTGAAATPPLMSGQPVTAKEAEDTSWKTDPNQRAFACMLSYEAGWMTPPSEIVWSMDAQGFVEVQRPAGHLSNVSCSRGKNASMKAVGLIEEIGRRWGGTRAADVSTYAFGAPPQAVGPMLPSGAHYLRQLARNAWTTAFGQYGDNRELAIQTIEAAFVDIVRTCADLARGANAGDESPSANQTRAVATARVLQLITPGRPS